MVDHSRNFRYDIVFRVDAFVPRRILRQAVQDYIRTVRVSFVYVDFYAHSTSENVEGDLSFVRSKQTVCIFIDVILIVYLFVRFHRTVDLPQQIA